MIKCCFSNLNSWLTVLLMVQWYFFMAPANISVADYAALSMKIHASAIKLPG
jgi:hypothetical protein